MCIEPKPGLQGALGFCGLAEIERRHAAHEMREREAWTELDRLLRGSFSLLELVGPAARDREAIVGIGILFIEIDGGERRHQTLAAYRDRIIAPAPQGDPARYACEPDVWIRRSRFEFHGCA